MDIWCQLNSEKFNSNPIIRFVPDFKYGGIFYLTETDPTVHLQCNPSYAISFISDCQMLYKLVTDCAVI